MERETASFSQIQYSELDCYEENIFHMDVQEFKNLHQLTDSKIMVRDSERLESSSTKSDRNSSLLSLSTITDKVKSVQKVFDP